MLKIVAITHKNVFEICFPSYTNITVLQACLKFIQATLLISLKLIIQLELNI